MAEKRIYGVSFGNGNDGVSQLFPSYYVKTDDPWKLAQAAMLAEFKPQFVQWAKGEMFIDGDADYTIAATILDPPEPCDDGSAWSESNGAWIICEVFPCDDNDIRDSVPMYESLEEALSADVLALVMRIGAED